jgi:hypothetical protein
MPTPGSDDDLRRIGDSPGDFLGLDLGPSDDGEVEDTLTGRAGMGSPVVPISSGLPGRRGSATTFALTASPGRGLSGSGSLRHQTNRTVESSQSPSNRSSLRLPSGQSSTLRSSGTVRPDDLSQPNSLASSRLASTSGYGYGSTQATPRSARSNLGTGSLHRRLPTRPDEGGKSIRRLNLHGRSGSTGQSVGRGYGSGFAGNEEDDDDLTWTTRGSPSHGHGQGKISGGRSLNLGKFPKTAGLFPSSSPSFSKRALSRSGSIVSTTQSIAQLSKSGLGTGSWVGGGNRGIGETPRTAVGRAFRKTGSAIRLTLGSRPGSSYDSDVQGDDDDEGDEGSEDERDDALVSDARYGFGHETPGVAGVAVVRESAGMEQNPGIEANGTRVWYSSYDSIDWLHDQVSTGSCSFMFPPSADS